MTEICQLVLTCAKYLRLDLTSPKQLTFSFCLSTVFDRFLTPGVSESSLAVLSVLLTSLESLLFVVPDPLVAAVLLSEALVGLCATSIAADFLRRVVALNSPTS